MIDYGVWVEQDDGARWCFVCMAHDAQHAVEQALDEASVKVALSVTPLPPKAAEDPIVICTVTQLCEIGDAHHYVIGSDIDGSGYTGECGVGFALSGSLSTPLLSGEPQYTISNLPGYIVAENSGYPAVYNIEWDPGEEFNLLMENSWVLGPYMKIIQEYQETLKGHPNPPAPNFTDY